MVTQDEDKEDKSTRQKVTATQTPQKTLVTQDEDKENKNNPENLATRIHRTKTKKTATQTHKKPWLHRTKTKKTKAQDRKVTATQTPQKTLVTQDNKEDKSTRQKSNSNTDPTKNLGYTGRRQRRQKHKTEK